MENIEPTQEQVEVPDLHTQEMMASEPLVTVEASYRGVEDVGFGVATETVVDPRPEPSKFGSIDPVHRFFWRGNDINGAEYIGSGDDFSKCNVQAGLNGSATCHLRRNPDFIEPKVVTPTISDSVTPRELNAFYNAGYEDGYKYYDDLRTLVLAWATDQALTGGLVDAESLPFVIYARYNP